MKLREAMAADEPAIRGVHQRAFGPEEGTLIADLTGQLLHLASSPPTLNLVAVEGKALLGHVAFSPLHSGSDGHLVGSLLAPLGVDPSRQNEGIGSQLVRAGLRELALREVEVVLVYGNPNYYARFGFQQEPAQHYLPPLPLGDPAGWQVIELQPQRPPDEPVPLTCVNPLNRPELW